MNWDASWIAVHLQYGGNIDIWWFSWGRDIYFDITGEFTDNRWKMENTSIHNSKLHFKFQYQKHEIITNKPKEFGADQ